ncbi:MAG: peptidoglycan DD-metalloendopeptidase family protein [Bacteroidetes bacterium]|nr:peptidoglycan DD-metalloendopeptidase family protein [Bacteroidota bacterium]MCL2303659.1 peptidoglycan DD-metalloendopeptidase family protein [Lentimicrobiaceae bacterium]
MLVKTIKLLCLSGLILLLPYAGIAQEDQTKKNQLSFSEDETLSFEETLVEGEEDIDEYEDDTGADQSMMFIYFKWMPGHGLYSNFDILRVHYVHDRTVNPDTIVLGNYVHPAKHKATSMYGVKRRRGRTHWGIDIPFPEGTPVVAAFNGIVRVSTFNNGGYGNLVVIRHDNNLETYYAHLSRRWVNPGQVVKAGDTIGLGGNTGRSRGSHLHFETRYLGTHFNPARIIDFQNHKLTCDTLYIGGKVIKTNADAVVSNVLGGPDEGTAPVYITVRKGDTLGHLARKHRTTIDRIKRLNNMRSDFLREGQRLRIR